MAIGHIAIDKINKCVPGRAPWPSCPLCNLLKKSSLKAFCKKTPWVASSIAKNHGRIMRAQMIIPRIGFKTLIKCNDFWKKQNNITVGINIANERGPFTNTPNEKVHHIMTGYKYLTLNDVFSFNISLSK